MAHTGDRGKGGNLSEIFVSYQGEGSHVGQKHLFVRFAGCNIRCRYCDTPESLTRVASCTIDYPMGEHEQRANPVTTAELAAVVEEVCRQDPGIGMIAITGGEPMVQAGFLKAWLNEYPPPLPCLLETNATLADGLGGLIDRLSVVSADVKLPSNSGERGLWEEHRRFLEACSSGVELYVKVPVDGATRPEEVAAAARLLRETVPGAKLFLQPVTEIGSGRWQIVESRLLELLACAAAEMPVAGLMPQMHKLLGVR
ncbi:MAG: 7-carboxy-7-deazaguanine synthase QueE [Deltaproteobacteria bacterium]